jgi:hypothetical protein
VEDLQELLEDLVAVALLAVPVQVVQVVLELLDRVLLAVPVLALTVHLLTVLVAVVVELDL